MKNKGKQQQGLELLVIFALSTILFIVSAHYDILEKIVSFSAQHENWELDEAITVSIFLVFALAVFSLRRWQELRKTQICLLQYNAELQQALSEIKQLRGILPICAKCKKIRDDIGYWHQVETYIGNHSEAEFTHGICPDCITKLYPDFKEEPEEGT